MPKRCTLLFSLILASACGGSNNTTTSPTPTPTPPTFSLTGQVTDGTSTTAAGISGATVSIADGPNAGKSASTDASGNYSLTGLQQSGFTVNATANRYVSSSKSVTLTSNQTVSFQLKWNLDGSWRASSPSTTIQGIDFRVVNGVIVEMGIQYLLSGNCAASMTQTNMSVPIPATSFTTPFSQSGFSTTVSATFASTGGGTGSVGTQNFTNWRCGTSTVNGFAGANGTSFTFLRVG